MIYAEDLQEKIAIVRNIIKLCESNTPINKISTLNELKDYTGIALDKNTSESSLKPKSLQYLEKRKNENILNESKLSLSKFRSLLKSFYITNRRIPTLQDISTFKEETQQLMHEDLVKKKPSGFLWKKIPGTDKSVIIEDPNIVMKRILYLKKMEQHRLNNAEIIYVETMDLTKIALIANKKYMDPSDANVSTSNLAVPLFGSWCCIALSMKNGLLGIDFVKPGNDSFENWLVNLVKTIGDHAVIVYEENEEVKVPTAGSLKKEMSDWLTKNDIPHNAMAHRGDLYTLIEKFKKNTKFNNCNVDKKLIALGHEVLKRPRCCPELNIFLSFWKTVISYIRAKYTENNLSDLQDIVQEEASAKNKTDWLCLEVSLMGQEKIMLEDLALDNIIDRLIAMASNENCENYVKELSTIIDWKTIASEHIID